MVPLTAGTKLVNDAVEDLPPILSGAACPSGWKDFAQDRLDPLPKRIGDLPDRFQRLNLTLSPRSPLLISLLFFIAAHILILLALKNQMQQSPGQPRQAATVLR